MVMFYHKRVVTTLSTHNLLKLYYTLTISMCGLGIESSPLVENYDRAELQKLYPGFGTQWTLYSDYDDPNKTLIGFYELPPHVPQPRLLESPEDVVIFTLFSRTNREGISVKVYEVESFGSSFDTKKSTKFITHGWLSEGSLPTYVSIKNGFLDKYDANVFIMDWSFIAKNPFYPLVVGSVKDVGNVYSEFLNQLVDRGANPESFHLVGHSLGAHVSGFGSRGVKKGNVGRITGLDPANPGFGEPGNRLNTQDAKFVDIIHTCGGYLGLSTRLGHADFYPNGGSAPQPGCGIFQEMIEGCSHSISLVYFAESLKPSGSFNTTACGYSLNFQNCRDEGVLMGDPAPSTARGVYYLTTDPRPPYFVRKLV